MYALNIDTDGRILSATYAEYAAKGQPIVETLPEGDSSNYLYNGGKYIYSPKPTAETAVIANRNITAGEYITVNGILYKATANIPNGGAIITGQNAEETTVEEQLYELTQKGE